MSNRDDTEYFIKRAATERKIADECADPAIAITHRRLAWEYERRVQIVSTPSHVSREN
jgi:hypothetical protein